MIDNRQLFYLNYIMSNSYSINIHGKTYYFPIVKPDNLAIEVSSENIYSINRIQEFTNYIKKNCLILESIIYNIIYDGNEPIIISSLLI